MTRKEELTEDELNFLLESNSIEREYSGQALADAILAWQYARTNKEKWLFDVAINVHERLMKNLRPDIAGRLRTVGVRVGNRICPAPELVRGLLLEWSGDWSSWQDAHLDEADWKESHVQFERIHPFEDGNGRVGRILYNHMRMAAGRPVHIIKAEDRQSYYKWFQAPPMTRKED